MWWDSIVTTDGHGPPPKSDAISFIADMPCCKPWRRFAGFSCRRAVQKRCAWHEVERIAEKGDHERVYRALQGFAAQLLNECAWPIGDVYWVFRAGGEMSALAQTCAGRCASMSTQASRDAFLFDLVATTSPEFVATFDVHYRAALGRT